MKNKKGWIRIAEAFIAIVIIAGVLVFIFTKTTSKPDPAGEIYNIEKRILDDVANNAVLRESILSPSPDEEAMRSFIGSKVPENLGFEVRVCDPEDVCGLPELKEEYTNGEIYAKERIISSTLTTQNTKKVKLFMWEK